PVLVGEASLRIYTVPTGTAAEVAKSMQDVYKASATCRITSAGNNRVLVHATPEDQATIAKKILAMESSSTRTKCKALDVGDLDPTTVTKTLQDIFGETKAGAPYIGPLADRNAVFVRGTTDQVEEVEETLKAIQGKGGSTGRLRTLTIDG